MASTTRKFASTLVVFGALVSGSTIAQVLVQPATATPPAAGAGESHSDPIVQKRMEVREASRQH